MFNFFDEIKKRAYLNEEFFSDFNIVNMSGKLVYIEGHQGLTVLSPQNIVFKVKKGRVVVEGENMILAELTENTMLLQGKIIKMEFFQWRKKQKS